MITSGLEAAGDTLTGAIIGRAVEPDHGTPTDLARGSCLNCGAALIGAHCHQCGQKALVHRTMRSYVHDLLHGVFHFEGKVWTTLPLLAFKPGELTRRYIHGERAKFVSPLALFLFAVFLSFAVIGGLAGDIATADVKSGPIEGLDTGWPRLDIAIEKANKNPNLLIYKLQTGAYKYSWALIPLSVPFLWLLFCWRREFKIYDHAVFVTYSLTFMLFLTVGLTIASTAGVPDPFIPLAAIAIPPIHIYRQLRGTYRVERSGAIVRTVALSMFGGMVLIAFLLLLLLVGIMG